MSEQWQPRQIIMGMRLSSPQLLNGIRSHLGCWLIDNWYLQQGHVLSRLFSPSFLPILQHPLRFALERKWQLFFPLLCPGYMFQPPFVFLWVLFMSFQLLIWNLKSGVRGENKRNSLTIDKISDYIQYGHSSTSRWVFSFTRCPFLLTNTLPSYI